LANPGDKASEHFEKYRKINAEFGHNQNPDAQWFPDAGLGLFLHWDQSSVKALNISAVGTGSALMSKDIKDPDELARIVREKDYNLDGKPVMTPNEYWALAKEFNPTDFHPEIFLKKAKDAGFNYAVMITKHHGGFCMWPSAYGDLNTKNSAMKGRDLVKEYVEACRAAGLKVGIYFSGPDYYLGQNYRPFMDGRVLKKYPGKIPDLDANYEPRTFKATPERLAADKEHITKMVRGQLEELLTHYGKIDMLWLDGTAPLGCAGDAVMSVERMRELQPGIIVTDRFHHHGDITSAEIHLPKNDIRLKSNEWGELCDIWSGD